MPKFEKEFVHFMWDDKLKGKNVLGSDRIHYLIEMVESGKSPEPVSRSTMSEYPFFINNSYSTRFVYYDPEYEEKIEFENWVINKITFKDLHHWLALGIGRYKEQDIIKSELHYDVCLEDEPISSSILVCKWEDTEWVIPTREYMWG